MGLKGLLQPPIKRLKTLVLSMPFDIQVTILLARKEPNF